MIKWIRELINKLFKKTEALVMSSATNAFYRNPNYLGETSVHDWLPLKKGALLSEVLHRSLRVDDLKALVQKDGTKKEMCYECGIMFYPVKAVLITDKFLKGLKKHGEVIVTEGCYTLGSIVPFIINGEFVPKFFCGALFESEPSTEPGIPESYRIKRDTCLYKGMHNTNALKPKTTTRAGFKRI